jgi:5,10-methylenetetrahydromethanopterin reductase
VTCEFWLHGFPVPGQAQRLAVRAEELGLDGLLLADSQNLVGDPFVELGRWPGTWCGAARRSSRDFRP